MLSILQLSDRRYAVVETDDTEAAQANLHVFSQGRLGSSGEMIVVRKSKVLTKKLDYDTAMLTFCLLSKKAPLTEDEWQLIPEDMQDEVARRYQPRS